MLKKFLYNLLVFLGIGFVCQAQFIPDSGKIKKKNLIELQYFNYHFFDGTSVLWPARFEWGITYTRLIHNWDHSISVTMHEFGRHYPQPAPRSRIQGEITDRLMYAWYLDYHYAILKSYKVYGWLDLGLSYRKGSELMHLGYPNWFEEVVETHNFNDFGINAGLKLSYQLPYHFIISIESNYSRFLFVKSKGIPAYTFDKGSPRNQLNFQLKCGYNF